MSANSLTLAVLFACAVSCSAFVLFCNYIIRPALEALWDWLKASDDPFGNAAYGDWPFVPSENVPSHNGSDTL